MVGLDVEGRARGPEASNHTGHVGRGYTCVKERDGRPHWGRGNARDDPRGLVGGGGGVVVDLALLQHLGLVQEGGTVAVLSLYLPLPPEMQKL